MRIYANTKYPRAIIISFATVVALSIICIVFYVVTDGDSPYHAILYSGWLLVYPAMLLVDYFLTEILIDEEADVIVDSLNRKHPLAISRLSSISYKESRVGKFVSLSIRDGESGTMEIRTSRKNAELICTHLTCANPSIVVIRSS